MLAYADFSKPFILHTDASRLGLGAVLYQEIDGREHPIAYASRSLIPSALNYPAHKLEFLGLKWPVCSKFRDYLYGGKFVVRTDNNPLTYVLSSAKLDATGQRWVSELSSYDFSIQYRSGKENIDADALSRLPQEVPRCCICQTQQVTTTEIPEMRLAAAPLVAPLVSIVLAWLCTRPMGA